MCGVYFCTLCPSIGPEDRSRQTLDRLPLVSNVLTNFWMQHFFGAPLSPNSVRNSVWYALNEPVCQYLRTRNLRCSTVYIDNSFGTLTVIFLAVTFNLTFHCTSFSAANISYSFPLLRFKTLNHYRPMPT